jgi:hypothetical protein
MDDPAQPRPKPTRFDEQLFNKIMSDVRSGNPDQVCSGLEDLSWMSRGAEPVLEPLMARMECDGFTLHLLTPEFSHGRTPKDMYNLSGFFLNLAAVSEGCEILIDRDVPNKLFDMMSVESALDPRRRPALENVLSMVGNIAGEGANAVHGLIDSGVFDRVVSIFNELVAGLIHVPPSLFNVAAWLLSNVFRFEPRLPYALAEPLLASLTQALKTIGSAHKEPLKDLMITVSYVFSGASDGVDWSYLHSSGLLRRVLDASAETMVLLPALRLVGEAAAHADPHAAHRICDDSTATWLAQLASMPTQLENNVMRNYLHVLAVLATTGERTRRLFFEYDLFGSQLNRLAERLRMRSSAGLLGAANKAARLIVSLVEAQDERCGPLLLDAGAPKFLAAVLAFPQVYGAPKDQETVALAAQGTRLLIELSGIDRDEAFIAGVAPPSNPYFAAFCAAGGCQAMKVINSGASESIPHVRDLFKGTIASIVGTGTDDGDAVYARLAVTL